MFRVIRILFGEKGFVIDISKETLKNKKQISNYLARYSRHPPIANSKILSCEDGHVNFYYVSHETNRRVDARMKIDDFIFSIIQHIPEKHFKVVRHYGAYSRNQKQAYQIF